MTASLLMRCQNALLFSLALMMLVLSGCTTVTVHTSQAFTVTQHQKMVPILPFTNTLVPESFSEPVFNDFVDNMNENQQKSGFAWFGIIKDNFTELEKILPPSHIFITGEIWSYIEDAGCCSTELRVKSRLRINRVLSREILWDVEIPLESFFEHDRSTLAEEREKLGKRLSNALTQEALKALQSAKRITTE